MHQPPRIPLMTTSPTIARDPGPRGPHCAKRPILGAAAGLITFLAIMIAIAAATAALGFIPIDPDGVVDLRPWLTLAAVGGTCSGLAAGFVARRIGRGIASCAILAAALFFFGSIEAAHVANESLAGRVIAPLWLVFAGPPVAAIAVLVGGMPTGHAQPVA